MCRPGMMLVLHPCGTRPAYPIGLDHGRDGLKIRPKSPSWRSIPSRKARKATVQDLVIQIVARQNSTHTAPETVDAVRALARICSEAMIANVRNRNGRGTGRGNFWTCCERVTALRSHHTIPVCSETSRTEDWLNLTESAKLVGVSARTLRLAVEQGSCRPSIHCWTDHGSATVIN